MTTTITPVAQYTNSDPSVTSGAEGGLAFDTGPGPMNAVLQMAFDRTLYARGSVWGLNSWSGEFGVDTGGSNTVFTVRVGIVLGMTLRDGNSVWRPYFTSAQATLDLTNVEFTPANLSNSKWYYVYGWSDSAAPSSVKWQISTSPPTEVAAPTVVTGYKRGEVANYRYVGCFVTDSSGAPVPVTCRRGRYTYRVSALAVAATRVLNAGTSTTYAAVSCAALIPPHALIGALRMELISTTAVAANFGNIQTNGDAGADAFNLYVPAANAATAYRDVEIQLDATQQVQYLVTAFNSAPTLSLYVTGWTE